MITKTGTIKKIKLLNSYERPLVYFKLDELNCLISHHSLNFLADVAEGMTVTVAGRFNKRGQFVAHYYQVRGKTKIMLDFDFSPYPRKQVY